MTHRHSEEKQRATLLQRKVCLFMEVETAIKLLKKGMGDLQNISGANDFYYAPILLLSSGYERLIKCLLCLAFMDEDMNFTESPYKTKGREGHDLVILLNRLLEFCKKRDYPSKFPAAKTDIDLLSTDENLREIVSLLSAFAQGGRYYNLDIFLTGASKYKDPKRAWEKIELTICRSRKDLWGKLESGDNHNIYEEINRELIITLEKFARALSRLFTLADIGPSARQASPFVYDYLMLMDKDLGTKDYRTS